MEAGVHSTSEIPTGEPTEALPTTEAPPNEPEAGGDSLVPIVELSISLRAARRKARDFRRRLSHLAGELAHERERFEALEEELCRERTRSNTLLRELDATNHRLQRAQLPLSKQQVAEGDVSYLQDRIHYVEAALEWLRQQEKVPNECSICIEHYDHTSRIVNLPCRHQFHFECIERWSYTFPSGEATECPSCRQPFALTHLVPAAWFSYERHPQTHQPQQQHQHQFIGPHLPPSHASEQRVPSHVSSNVPVPLLLSSEEMGRYSRVEDRSDGSEASSTIGE